jgi:hypothetical protein
MAQISRQIGWSQESNLLYQILKQLNKLTSILFGLKPKYKVYTALLTQSGGDNVTSISFQYCSAISSLMVLSCTQ